MKRDQSPVNYETEWQHDFLDDSQALYFDPKTPIKDIVPNLENHLKKLRPTLLVDYTSNGSTTMNYFNRLYRNIIFNYKNWRVRYRKPGSQKDYGEITERIGYKARQPKKLLKQTVLKKHMLWTHELDLLIDPVEIKGVDSCETIAQRLNRQMAQPCYDQFFNDLELKFDNLAKTLKGFNKRLPTVENKNNEVYQRFNKNFEKMLVYQKQFQLFSTKDYTVKFFGIHDVLEKTKTHKTAKGWQVEFLD